MANEKRVQAYREFLKYDDPKARLHWAVEESVVVEAFKGLLKAIGRKRGLRDLTVATELLLRARDKGQLNWLQLQALTKHRIDYCAVLEKLGDNPATAESLTERFTYVKSVYDRYPGGLSRTRVQFFTMEIARLTRQLLGEAEVLADTSPR